MKNDYYFFNIMKKYIENLKVECTKEDFQVSENIVQYLFDINIKKIAGFSIFLAIVINIRSTIFKHITS